MTCYCGSQVESSDLSLKCEQCLNIYHTRCLKLLDHQKYDVLSFRCQRCKPPNGKLEYRKRTNWHRYDWADEDPDGKPVQTGTVAFTRMLLSRQFPSATPIIISVQGSVLSKDYFLINGFHKPILVNKSDGLGLIVPPNTYSLDSITAGIGKERVIDVINVGRQEDFTMTLGDFMAYFKGIKNQTKVLNVISLEFSDTPLASYVEPPFIVRKLCWATNYWPNVGDCLKDKPQVSKYCLLSPAGAYTDFHVDFGGSSVWYHVLRGEKTFYLIPPTTENLESYETWSKMPSHHETFFGNLVPKCYSLAVKTGQTLFLPSGWIHAVLTTKDTVVFGGNFLCSLAVEMQFRVYDIEKRAKAPKKFQFPRFEAMNWYAGTELLEDLNEGLLDNMPALYLINVKCLFKNLIQWAKDREGNIRKEPYPTHLSLSRFVPDLTEGLDRMESLIRAANIDSSRCIKPVSFDEIAKPLVKSMTGIDELLLASELAETTDSDNSRGGSPFQEAVSDMIFSKYNPDTGQETLGRSQRNRRLPRKKRIYGGDDDDIFKHAHQDDDFIYPSLELDDNDVEPQKRPRKRKGKKGRGNSYVDEAWSPNKSVRGVLPKEKRPSRPGAKVLAVEKVLEESRESERPMEVSTEPSSSQEWQKKTKKGLSTPKQRLGKILKLNRMFR
ncbi:lysine-specific demethylase phf2-like isoform X2 [Artemia franciscana]|uniref:JmjC domain-containing protein n=1 Tax=Artemia franciscana TaxID=6661 RepID=A0AA88HP60_ARTSF|nr:hypothetical protein QYM36_011686 [Artemia franciscana]